MWIGAKWWVLLAVDWSVTTQQEDCTFYRAPTEANGVVPVRAECDWEIDVETAVDLLSDQGRHDQIFEAVAESTVLSEVDDRRRVYQVQRARGVNDRHVILEYTQEIIDGGRRFRWVKSSDQSSLREEGVEVEVTEGFWEVRATDDGLHLAYELRYLPGGNVPAFVMGWFQGMGTRMVIDDLRQSLEAHRVR